VFLPEIAGRDAFAALTGLAGETTTLLLGTGVVPMTSRIPTLTAMAAATLQERSGGRAILGIGSGRPAPGALDALRTQIEEIRASLRDGISLRIDPPPIWTAGLGPRAVRLAGEVADGVLLNWCTPERVAEARRLVAEGAEAAGRAPDAITVAAYVRAGLGDDPDVREALRTAAEIYGSYPAYARQFESMGIDAGRPDDVIGAVCLTGDGSEARERLQAYRDAGTDLPIVYPVLPAAGAVVVATETLEALATPP